MPRKTTSKSLSIFRARPKITANPRQPAGLGTLPEWNLAELYPSMDSPAFASDLAKAATECNGFNATYKGHLEALAKKASGSGLLEAIRRYEALEELLGRIMAYAGLVYAEDTTDPARMKFYGDAQENVTNASSDMLFFELDLNRFDGRLAAQVATGPLKHYRPWLEDIRKGKPYQLDDKLEKLFHEKSITGYGAWNRLFDETIASLRFNVDGKMLAIEPVLNLMQDPDEKTRERAAVVFGAGLKENLRIFALVTNTLAKDKEISDRWRGFRDVADARHLANRVEREVIDALVSAVRAAYPRLSHRYYRLKAKWFGKAVLKHWDRNAPLPHVPAKVYPWDEAREIVLDAYDAFAPKMADTAKRFFDERWIDAPVRPGKQPGAFAHPTVPSAHPYVLLNYQGKPRDVMTLAHELGHGVHQVLAGPNGALMAPTPLTLAETASVFGEMLTFRALLLRTANAEQRRAMLAAKVEDMLNTVVRQIAFYQFETRLHDERRGGELVPERIGDIWLDVQRASLGPAFEFTSEYRAFWSYVPHFIHSPFYVYAYAFGDCLVNALYGVF
ncbi:MAG: M3 family oligoendopeptidase, partial [Methylocella sp.]